MQPRHGLIQFVLIGVLGFASGGCFVLSDGARSAQVVLVRDDGSTIADGAVERPPDTDLKTLLAAHHLWLARPDQAAQWIAFVGVHAFPSPLRPPTLTLLKLKKSSTWPPPPDSHGSPGL